MGLWYVLSFLAKLNNLNDAMTHHNFPAPKPKTMVSSPSTIHNPHASLDSRLYLATYKGKLDLFKFQPGPMEFIRFKQGPRQESDMFYVGFSVYASLVDLAIINPIWEATMGKKFHTTGKIQLETSGA